MRRSLRTITLVLTLAVLLGACGGGDDDDASPTTVAGPTTTVAATTATTAADGDLIRLPEVFTPVAGYTYVDVPDADLEQVQGQFTSDPDTREAILGLDARTVERDGEEVAAVIALRFDKRSSSLPGFADGFYEGVTSDAVTSKTITVSGEKATSSTDADDAHYITWIKGDLALVVVGEADSTVLPIATGLIAANK